jgi:chromosome transmission fidelity protein 18
MEALHIPASTAAIHLFCRVEQRPELTLSTRELSDSQFKREANSALLQKYIDGVSLRARCARSANKVALEALPYALWALSAGEGSSALSRPTTSMELLGKGELHAFEQHAAILHSLGLSYVPDHDEATLSKEQHVRSFPYRLDPPIERLAQYSGLPKCRLEVPVPVSTSISSCCEFLRSLNWLGPCS